MSLKLLRDPEARVLYRDASVLVVDKPAGVAVHAAPGTRRTLDPWFEELRFGLKWRPELAHRLDRETSGCLVLGRHPRALRELNALFASGAVDKTYWALVGPPPADDSGEIDLPLKRVRRAGHWLTIADADGQSALTRWRVLARNPDFAWLELQPATGRTHQLRAHCSAKGMPVYGDSLYGTAIRGGTLPLHLHARAIGFTLGRRRIEVTAAPPPRFQRTLDTFFPKELAGSDAALPSEPIELSGLHSA